MQTYNITNSTDYINNILKPNISFKIHSVYENTINLIIDTQILALQTYNTVISPISLITDLKSFNINTNSKAYTNNNRIFIDDFCFDYSKCEFINCKLYKNSFDLQSSCLKAAIDMADCEGFNIIFSQKQAKNNFLILNAAQNRINSCTTALLSKEYENAADIISNLIGLGIGLTPSGDDFLCGVLAGLIFCDLSSHSFCKMLKTKITHKLKNTNDISGAFLKCALQDNFSSVVLNLPNFNSSAEIYDNFKKIGHSSGIDTLCGIYYSLNTIAKILKKDA